MTRPLIAAFAALLATTATAHADDWTGYTYSAVSTTSAVKGMTRIGELVAEETGVRSSRSRCTE
ncbi:hypothetical protein [Sulfitobacter sp.]|uniref:hypothetical protein n=1 Tax=Sulfitobacter sp. TaxID=1903071 RepID=UPI0040584614